VKNIPIVMLAMWLVACAGDASRGGDGRDGVHAIAQDHDPDDVGAVIGDGVDELEPTADAGTAINAPDEVPAVDAGTTIEDVDTVPDAPVGDDTDDADEVAPSDDAGTPAGDDAGAPVVEVDAGTPPAPAAITSCALGGGVVRGCDDFTQQHFPTLSISWGFDPNWDGSSPQITYGCDSDPLVACATGAPCSVYDSNNATTREGTCL
jgi:hypothetical protein